MAIKDFFDKIAKKIKTAIIVHKSKSQTKKTDFADLADTIGAEFVTPERNTGVIESGVESREYDAAGSTSHVKSNELSGIYFTDVISRTLSEAMQEQYKNEYRAKYVYIPEDAMKAIIAELPSEEVEELKTAGIIDENNKMTVENYRKWQMDVIANREASLEGNSPEKVFAQVQKTVNEHIETSRTRGTKSVKDVFTDKEDSLGIASLCGGKGILSKYLQNTDIPVMVLAVSAIMSVTDKNGNPVPLKIVKNDGKIFVPKDSYMKVREALGDDPLVNFLDEFAGYEIVEGKVQRKNTVSFMGSGLARGQIRGFVGAIVNKDKDAFLVSPETFVTRRDLRNEAIRINSKCNSWVKQVMADYKESESETLFDSEALNSAAIEFAEGVTNNGAQNPFLTRRKEKVLQIVVTNQSAKLQEDVKGIINKYTEEFKPEGDKKVKFTVPKTVDIKSVYASDFSVLAQNILLIDDVQSQLTLDLDSISDMTIDTPERVDRVLGNLKITREQVETLAKKYGVKDLDKLSNKQFVELAIKLRSKEKVAKVIDFNTSILDLVTLKEDLRVCEHVLGQFKFNNLQAADDAYKAAVEAVKQQQEAVRKEIKDKQLAPAQAELTRLAAERRTLKNDNITLGTKLIELQERRQSVLSQHVKTVQPKIQAQFESVVARILEAEKRNAENRVPNIADKNIKGLINNAIQAILTEDIYDANGKIDYFKLADVVSEHIGNVANSVHRIALGTKDETVTVDEGIIANYTDGFIDNVSPDLNGAVLNVGAEIAPIDSEIKSISTQIDDNNKKIDELDTLITAQKETIEKIETEIKNVPDIPKDTRDLIIAEKTQRKKIAEVKITEAETMITSILGIVKTHEEAMTDLTSGEYSIFEVKEGQLVLKDDEALKALVGDEAYTQYKTIIEEYGTDSKKLAELMSGKVNKIVEIAKKDFDIVIELDKDGNPVFDTESGKIKAMHIDNPYRVKADIDPRVVQLYEHQSKIDRYTQIKNETDPTKRAELIKVLSPAEQREFNFHSANLDSYIDSQIESELQSSDRVRMQYSEMEEAEKVKFQQDYARVKHYETGDYIPANADESEVAITIEPELAEINDSLSIISEKQRKKEAKETTIADAATVATDAATDASATATATDATAAVDTATASTVDTTADATATADTTADASDAVPEATPPKVPPVERATEPAYTDEDVIRFVESINIRGAVARLDDPESDATTRTDTLIKLGLPAEKIDEEGKPIEADPVVVEFLDKLSTSLETADKDLSDLKPKLPTDPAAKAVFLDKAVEYAKTGLDSKMPDEEIRKILDKALDSVLSPAPEVEDEADASAASAEIGEFDASDKVNKVEIKQPEFTDKGIEYAIKKAGKLLKNVKSDLAKAKAGLAAKKNMAEEAILRQAYAKVLTEALLAEHGITSLPTPLPSDMEYERAVTESTGSPAMPTNSVQDTYIVIKYLKVMAERGKYDPEMGAIVVTDSSGKKGSAEDVLYEAINVCSNPDKEKKATRRQRIIHKHLHEIATRKAMQNGADILRNYLKSQNIDITQENVDSLMAGTLMKDDKKVELPAEVKTHAQAEAKKVKENPTSTLNTTPELTSGM